VDIGSIVFWLATIGALPAVMLPLAFAARRRQRDEAGTEDAKSGDVTG
jgi:hypothetical protein